MATNHFGSVTGKRRPISYPDPTGDAAASHVDRECAATLGYDPDIARDLADAYLPPPVDPIADDSDTAGARDSDGARTAVTPFVEVGPYGLVDDAPLTNDQVSLIVRQLAPQMARWDAA